MKFLRTQILFLQLVILAFSPIYAQEQDRELQELNDMAQTVQIFRNNGLETKGAVVLNKSEEDWISDELSTGAAAAPIRESDHLLKAKTPVEQRETEFQPEFPLAPEEKSAPRRRSR